MRRLIFASLCLAACSGSSQMMPPPDNFPPPQNGIQIQAPYAVDPHSENYFCYATTVSSDVGVIELDVDAGTIVHHLLVAQTISPEPDGMSVCPSLIKQTWIPLYGGGRSTPGLTLPPGDGFKFPAGTQILVQLHLLNASDNPVSETTKINLIYGDDPASLIPAGIFAVGSLNFTIPTGATGFDVTGQCSVNHATPLNVFALFPHMHRLGTAIQIEHGTTQADSQLVYRVDPWSFGDQPMQMQTMTVNPGDFLKTTCTYDNTDGKPVSYGESSFDEMCFMVLFYTPFDHLGGCFGG